MTRALFFGGLWRSALWRSALWRSALWRSAAGRLVMGGALAAWAAVACERGGGSSESSESPEGERCPPDVQVAGPLMRDASPLLGAEQDGVCRIDGEGRLSASCLPRCSLAVRPAFYACPGPGCEDDVVATDSTAAISAQGAAGAVELNCAGCIGRARSLCLARTCPSELAARDACYASAQASGCVEENAAFNACFLNHQHVYEPCLFLAEESCFSGAP